MVVNRFLVTAGCACSLLLFASCSKRTTAVKQNQPQEPVVLSVSDAPAPRPRVLLISFDGLRPDAISKENTPVLQQLIDTGSYHPAALAEVPCITLPNHASMVTGLAICHHGVWFNSTAEGRINSRTVFDAAKEAGVPVAYFACKKKLGYLCSSETAVAHHVELKVEQVADQVIEAMRESDPRLIFVHFGEPDGAGHRHGWMTSEYFAATARSDAALGKILAAIDEAGTRAETTVIVSADHGGHGKTHGFDIAVDRHIPFIMQGNGVAAGRRLCEPIRTMDSAATALHMLGLPTESARDGRVITEAMSDSDEPLCDLAMPAFGVMCGPLPGLFFLPMMLAGPLMRRLLERSRRSVRP